MKNFLASLVFLPIASSAFGAALVVSFDSGGFILQNSSGVPLTGGAVAVPGDGVVVQLGYFTGATTNDNNFVGSFVPLTGRESSNFATGTQFNTTIGDRPADLAPDTNGQFSLGITFDTTLQSNLPAVGTILSIRVFDKLLPSDQSAKFLTVSNNSWKWKAPGSVTDPNSQLAISLADPGLLRMENRLAAGGTASTPSGSPASANLQATIPVPEPSGLLLLSLGALVSLKRRRK